MKDRIKRIYNYLKFNELVETQESLANTLGYSRASVTKALNGDEKYLTHDFFKRLNTTYREMFSENWLFTGEGSMLANDSASEGEAQPDASAETLTDENSLKYYYELAATAGNIEDMADNELHQPFRRLLIPGFEGTTAFTVTGDSMEPTAKAGDIVAIDRKQAEVIVNGEIYFIVTRDGQRMIKRLVRHDGDENDTPRFSCISDNADKSLYAPFLLSADNIHTLHRVVGFISISHLG